MANPSILAFDRTPANNGASTTGVNFQEGQAPSTVNDSARSLMSRLAFYRDWLAGNVTQGGSSNAYTLTSGETLTAYSAGMRFLWKPNGTSSGAVTLNVDGIGAKKVYRPDGTQAGSGDILAGTLLDVVYLPALDSTAGGFQIVGGLSEATSLSMSAQYRLVGRSSSGAGSSEEVASSAAIFAFLGAADAAAARASLGLAIGTNVQAYSANLQTYSGITPSANVQSILGAADYAAMRTQLSLGTAALATIGTSGDTVPKNNTSNVFSAVQTWENASANSLTRWRETGTSNLVNALYQAAGTLFTFTPGPAGTLDFTKELGYDFANSRWFVETALAVDGAITSGGNTVATSANSLTLSNKTLSSPTLSGTVAGAPTVNGAWTFSGNLQTITRSAEADEGLRISNSTTSRRTHFRPGDISSENGNLDLDAADGNNVNLQTSGTTRLEIGTSLLRATVPLQSAVAISSETSGTLTSASSNKQVNASGDITINDGVHAAGDRIEIYAGASARSIVQDTGMTLRLDGSSTTGTRSLAARGRAALYFVSNSEAIVSGMGVT